MWSHSNVVLSCYLKPHAVAQALALQLVSRCLKLDPSACLVRLGPRYDCPPEPSPLAPVVCRRVDRRVSRLFEPFAQSRGGGEDLHRLQRLPLTLVGPFRGETVLHFTRDGQPALTSAFGTFFIGNHPVDGQSEVGLAIGLGNFTLAGFAQPAFLGLATIDSVTGQLVPSINEIAVVAGGGSIDTYLDNFTFAGNPGVSPVPEGNAWTLLAAAALAAAGLGWRRRFHARLQP